jgi:molecular chaperone HtpG
MTVEAHKENLGFQAEVQQLLHLVVHSLYSNKEIFLRELVSNASDACDKLRFEALTDDALYENDSELKIHIAYDKDARTLTISDNGIGMSRQEVVDNIGVIAGSGTRQFFAKLTGDQSKDSQLIGQFGVGFYSSFIVADKVTLLTRRAGLGPEHGVRWESTGETSYVLETVEKPTRGTEITLHLKKDEDKFLDEWRLRGIINKYSDHISLPIVMRVEKPAEKEGEKPVFEEQTINRASAFWTRSKNDIKDDEYIEFYKHTAHDFQDPLAWTHNRVEGNLEYTSLLYIPARAPFDLWDRDQSHGVKLYVRRVFIMEGAEQLMPRYLRFVRGVIDSNDLPLNVSREILQSHKIVDSIRGGSVKKILSLLEDLAKNQPEKYTAFWKEFGRVLKEGPAEDFTNREQIAKLLRFVSTHDENPEQRVSLTDYVGRMKEGQDKIYYITADSLAAAKHSPHLEIFRKKGLEVLLLSDRVDEWLMAHLAEFDGKPLQSVAKGQLDLDKVEEDTDKEEQKQVEESFKDLLTQVKETLGDDIGEARISKRLTDSPACLVVDEHAMSGHLERLLREAGQPVPETKPHLELNPSHLLVTRLKEEQDKERFSEWTRLLFEQAMLVEGGQLEDPARFVQRLNNMLLTLTQS